MGVPSSSSWEDAPTLYTFPLYHISGLLPFFSNPKEGDDNPALPSVGSCVSSHGDDLSITAPKPQEETRGFQFNHRHQGKWGKSLVANPKEIPLSGHLSPLTGGNKSRKGRFARRKTSPPYWIFFPLFSKQCLVLVTCNPPSRGISRPPGMQEPGGILPQTSRAAALPCFSSPGLPAARAASSTIGQSPTRAHPPPSAAPPSAVSFP